MMLVIAIFVHQILLAKVNLIEPWRVGIDVEILPKGQYDIFFGAKAGTGNNFYNGYFGTPFVFKYGITKNLEFGLCSGLLAIKKEDTYTGLSDMDIGIKYKMKTEEETIPAVIFEFITSLPIADYTKNLGTGNIGFSFLWAAKKHIKTLNGYLSFSYRMNFNNPLGIKYGDVFSYSIGIDYPYKEFLFGVAIKGFNHSPQIKNDKILKDTVAFETYLSGGLKYRIGKDYRFESSLLLGLTGDSHALAFISGFSILF